jgi:hypothetical protein
MKITLTELDIEKTAGRLANIGKGVKNWWKGTTPAGIETGKGFGSMMGGAAKKGLALGGAGLIIGGGAAGAQALGSAIHNKATSGRRFDAMLEHYPTLKKHNRKALKQRWKTLNRFSPALAKDPLIAGTFLKRTMELGGDIDIKTIGEIAKARKDLSSGKGGVGDAFTQSMIKGLSFGD